MGLGFLWAVPEAGPPCSEVPGPMHHHCPALPRLPQPRLAPKGEESLREEPAFHLRIKTGVSIIVVIIGTKKGLDASGVGAVYTCLF